MCKASNGPRREESVGSAAAPLAVTLRPCSTAMADSETAALDTLCELFPRRSRPDLRRYLVAANSDLERAFRAIENGKLDSERPSKRSRTRTANDGLAQWVKSRKRSGAAADDGGVLILSDSDEEDGPAPSSAAGSKPAPPKPPLKSAFDLLKPAERPPPAPDTPSTHVNLPPLTLRTPDMVAKHTEGLVTLVENALPTELASRLYVKMVRESVGEGQGEACQSKTSGSRNPQLGVFGSPGTLPNFAER